MGYYIKFISDFESDRYLGKISALLVELSIGTGRSAQMYLNPKIDEAEGKAALVSCGLTIARGVMGSSEDVIAIA